MKSLKEIVCITSSYPYGSRETYFESELKILSEEYELIHIVPLYNPYGSVCREVPENVRVYNPLIPQGFKRLLLLLNWLFFFPPLLKEFFCEKVFFSKKRLNRWLNAYALYISGVKFFKKQNFDDNVVFYSYWAEAPFFLHSYFYRRKKVVRMHGADFYIERNDGYLPLRKAIYDNVNLTLPISQDIANRLQNVYKVPAERVRVSYLGIFNAQDSCAFLSNPVKHKFKIVSCSNVYPLKRVHLIFEILKIVSIKFDVEWHHIGDGESMQALRSLINNSKPGNLDVKFHGQMTQEGIYQLYNREYFHWFFNVSIFEGLPVSIMEAFSFGVPVLATNVGATSEIVNLENGILIERDFNVSKVAQDLITATVENSYKYKRVGAYNQWNKNFNGYVNYKKLVDKLKEI